MLQYSASFAETVARSSVSLAENDSNACNVYSPGRLRALQCLRADVRCALDASSHPKQLVDRKLTHAQSGGTNIAEKQSTGHHEELMYQYREQEKGCRR